MSLAVWLPLLLIADPVPPGRCAVRAVVEKRGDATVAALTLAVTARTTVPRQPVLVGGGKAFATDARTPDGKPVELVAGADGLSAVFDRPGDHTVVVSLDAPVSGRGAGEFGFEVGLPRAAITTLTVKPPAGVGRVSVGVTAADRPGETTRTTEPTATLDRPPDRPGYPLGPAERLVVTWEPPAAGGGPLVADWDAAVRVDDAQVELTATAKVRGPAGPHALRLPPEADASLDPADSPAATLARTQPGDWLLTLAAAGERTVRVTARTPRPPVGAPVSVGPLLVPAAGRQGGGLRVKAPPAVRLDLRPAAWLRREDAPPDDTVAAYRWEAVGLPPAGPLLVLDARPAAGGVRVKPTFTLKRVEAGWRLDAAVTVTPARAPIDELAVRLPAGWTEWAVGPPEVADELVPGQGDTPAVVRLTAPQRAGFDLTLSAVFPQPPAAREAVLPLPGFPAAAVAATSVAAELPAGLELVRGVARTAAGPVELVPVAGRPGAAVIARTGTSDRPPTAVDLAWQPHRSELAVEVRAEVTVHDRQTAVVETIRLKPADPDGKPVRLRGPAAAVDLRASPAVEAAGPGEWLFRPPADAREVTVILRYALPNPPRGVPRVPVGLVWPDATATTAHARVWGGPGRRPVRVDGPWRELPPEPSADRDSLPAFTLTGSGTALPLAVELADPADGGLPATAVERALVQGWLADGGVVAVRGRFVLKRWPAGGVEVTLPPGAANLKVEADRRRADPVAENGGVRVPLPESRDGRGLLLDVAFTLPPAGGVGPVRFPPPVLKDADFRGPVRWQLLPPAGATLLVGPGLSPDLAWGWRRAGLGPVSPTSDAELDAWLDTGSEPDTAADGRDAVTGRQAAVGPVAGLAVPRAGWVAGWSLLACGGGLLFTRLRPRLVGPAVGLCGAGLAVAAALLPQPTAEAAAAAQPGLAGLAALLLARAASKWYARWRADNLPGFTRTVPEPPGSTTSRPASAVGS